MNRKGQTTIEYVLVAVLIVIGIILAYKGVEIDKAIGNAAGNVQDSLLVEE